MGQEAYEIGDKIIYSGREGIIVDVGASPNWYYVCYKLGKQFSGARYHVWGGFLHTL
jgi:hypothetical protein